MRAPADLALSPPDKKFLPRRWQWWRRLANAALALVLLSWSLILIAWLTLHWAILPHIDHWRPRIERLASDAIGVKLSIGEITVRSRAWAPTLELRDLRLFDRDGREALRLQQVQAALATHSLLALQLRFKQLVFDGLTLDVRRDAAGRLSIAGFEWKGGQTDGHHARGRDWLFEQGELVLRNATLRVNDELAGTEALTLNGIDAVLRNGTRTHALRVDATPPAALGQRLSLRARFTQPVLANAGDLQRWSGTMYAELPHVDLGVLRRYLALPFEIDGGEGALRAWVDVTRGVPDKATLDLALRDTALRLAPNLQPLAFALAQGRLDTSRDADGVRLATRGLVLQSSDGPDWPAGDLKLSWRQKQDLGSLQPSQQPVTGGELGVERLDLDRAARTAERLPLGQPVRQLLAQLAPRGHVEGLKAQWTGPLDAPTTYSFSARLSGLHLQPGDPVEDAPARPGVRNAQLQIDADETGGRAHASIRTGALLLPGVWQDPALPLDSFDAELAWHIKPSPGRAPTIQLELKQVRLANADLAGEMRASWSTGDGEGHARGGRFPGLLDLSARLSRGRAERVARYLPLRLAEPARNYVERAIQSGQIKSADFRVKGDLWDFPFHRSRDGELRIEAQFQDLRLDYVPGRPASTTETAWVSPWPAFEQISGELEFDRLAMRLRGLQGQLWGTKLRNVAGGIADLADPAARLELAGQVRGPAEDLLRYVRSTPLSAKLGTALQPLAASGASDLKLELSLPLARPALTRVRGNLRLSQGELRALADWPALQGLRGELDFTQDSFTLRSAQARWLGGDLSFDGALAPDGKLLIGAQGVATAEALRALPAVAAPAAVLRGQAAWRATLALDEGRSDFNLASNLVGMQIDLPTPLAKPVQAAWPMRLQRQGSAATPATDTLVFELGEALKMQWQRDLSVTPPRVQGGAVAVFDTLPAPSPEIPASLKLGRVDVDAWQAVLQRMVPQGEVAQAAGGYLPRRIALRADELIVGGKSLNRVVADIRQSGTADQGAWQARVQSEQLVGDVEYRSPSRAESGGGVRARLQRLSLPQSAVAQVEQLLGEPPPQVPALDIVAEDFELRGRKLGRLQVQAVNRQLPGRAGAREWQLDTLKLDTPEAKLQASGRWQGAGLRRMALDFKLDLSDSGAFIQRMGGGAALRGGKGALSGQLSWAGSPLSLDYPSLEGALTLDIDGGQFMNADPGSARLIGVLGLQSLARRMSFDFRDLFEEGFAFDSITGTVQVARGVADTRDLRMQGLQATVLMQGSANLQRETQDLRVLVVPNFDASGAALATLAINPAIGLGALFAQWALREPLMAAATREFHITGSWAEPQVQTVERALGTLLPSAGPTTAATSTSASTSASASASASASTTKAVP